MTENLTIISLNNMTFIRDRYHTPQEMVAFLKEGAMIRSFSYMLDELRPGEDVGRLLTDGLTEITGEKRDSVSKKVRNWRNGRNLPKDRETMFQICFILQLSEEQADRLIGRLSDTGIHYRNPAELSYAYALRTGRTYEEARRLKETALALYEQETKKPAAQAPEIFTSWVRKAFYEVDTDEKFESFIRDHSAQLGQMHETSYRKFKELLKLLQNPEEGYGEAYSLADVMREYMQMRVPVQQRGSARSTGAVKKSDMDVFQKMVRLYWPNESTLSRMQNRTEDVSRKTLLLLYLATESFDDSTEDEEDFWIYEDVEEDPDILLETRIEKVNLFLHDCGMNRLDPGNPFDLLFLYAMKTEQDEEARARMEDVLAVLFKENEEDKEPE